MSGKRFGIAAGLLALVAAGGAAWYLLGTAPPPSAASDGTSTGTTSPVADTGGAVPRTLAEAPPLPVMSDLDLTHVEPKHFAQALGKDPVRIFNYVRDGIAFELYAGALRGPRGTLLALAGNSVDRASLLASLLQQSGHKVRFAHGTLSPEDATRLVTSMWTSRTAAPQPAGTTSTSALSAAGATFASAANRDYRAISELLQRASPDVMSGPVPTLQQLAVEALTHYWVQWMKDGEWTDLDPSFADSAPGRAHAAPTGTSDTLPDSLFHRVAIRVQVEEFTGLQREVREVLSTTIRAADLPAVDVFFSHLPENWTESSSLETAVVSALEETGRVAPVLVVGERAITGRAFQQQPSPTTGLSGLGGMLAGRGSREAVPLATAEWFEFDFIAPDGGKQTIARDVFDVLGPSRRRSVATLTADDIKGLTSAPAAGPLTKRFYSLLFSTGRIVEGHLMATSASGAAGSMKIDAALRRLAITMQAVSDVMTARLMEQEKNLHIYLDSPRLTIVELQEAPAGKVRVSIDLRRDTHRTVTRDGNRSTVISASVARGVVASTLERLLLDYAVAQGNSGADRPSLAISASALFEAAAAQQVPLVLLPARRAELGAGMPADALARIEADSAAGLLTLAPSRALMIAGVPRWAWWRIDPRTGVTTGVTDDGLHGSSRVLQGPEYIYRTGRNRDGVLVVRAYYRDAFGRLTQLADDIDPNTWEGGISAVFRWLRAQGFVPSFRPLV